MVLCLSLFTSHPKNFLNILNFFFWLLIEPPICVQAESLLFVHQLTNFNILRVSQLLNWKLKFVGTANRIWLRSVVGWFKTISRGPLYWCDCNRAVLLVNTYCSTVVTSRSFSSIVFVGFPFPASPYCESPFIVSGSPMASPGTHLCAF